MMSSFIGAFRCKYLLCGNALFCAAVWFVSSVVFAQAGSSDSEGRASLQFLPQSFVEAMNTVGNKRDLVFFDRAMRWSDAYGLRLVDSSVMNFVKMKRFSSVDLLDLRRNFSRKFRDSLVELYAFALLRDRMHERHNTLVHSLDFELMDTAHEKVDGLAYRINGDDLILSNVLESNSIFDRFSMEKVLTFFESVKDRGFKLRLPQGANFRPFAGHRIFIDVPGIGLTPLLQATDEQLKSITVFVSIPFQDRRAEVRFLAMPMGRRAMGFLEDTYFKALVSGQGRQIADRPPPREPRPHLADSEFGERLGDWFLRGAKSWPKGGAVDFDEATLGANVSRQGGQVKVFLGALSLDAKRSVFRHGALPSHYSLIDHIAATNPVDEHAYLSLAMLMASPNANTSDLKRLLIVKNNSWNAVFDEPKFSELIADLKASLVACENKLQK